MIYDSEFWDFGVSPNRELPAEQMPMYGVFLQKYLPSTTTSKSQANRQNYHRKEKKRFCIYLARGNAQTRNKFYKILSRYRRVDALSDVYRNGKQEKISDTGWKSNTTHYAPYKFVLAFENSYSQHYLSEKILMPLLAGSVPIYWGGNKVAEVFNPDCFINAYDFDSLEALAKYVLKVDTDDTLYESYLQSPIYKPEQMAAYAKQEAHIAQNVISLASHQLPAPKAQTHLVGREIFSRVNAISKKAQPAQFLSEKWRSTYRRHHKTNNKIWPFL